MTFERVRLVDFEELYSRFGINFSKVHLRRLETRAVNPFPRAMNPTGGRRFWVESEVAAWLEAEVAQRAQRKPKLVPTRRKPAVVTLPEPAPHEKLFPVLLTREEVRALLLMAIGYTSLMGERTPAYTSAIKKLTDYGRP